jgi:DNA repair protein RecN (Recombination protein N)
MLLHLSINNFAIVSQLEIDWQQGMTTITGETGAGKSIAIDALGLCLGDRIQTNAVRPGCKKAELVALFDINNNQLATHWLDTNELIDEEQPNECILRRVISAEGRSRAYINGQQVPLAQLRSLGELLINIHGQQDHQLISKPLEQRRLLDAYAKHEQLIEDVAFCAKQHRKLTSERQSLEESQQQREATRQLLAYQVQELDDFAISEDEFEQLENDYKRHSNAQQLLTQSQLCLHHLIDNEQVNALALLRQSADTLSSLSEFDQNLAAVAQTLQESVLQVEDAGNELRHYSDRLELDPEYFSQLEERYSQAVNLAKKHLVAPENLYLRHLELAAQLKDIGDDQSRLDGLQAEIETCQQTYMQASKALTHSRQQAGEKLSMLISQSMQELNMPKAEFKAAISQSDEHKFASHGVDIIEFLVSMNPGQPLEAMNKVASGGELSRISLAIQVILAAQVVTPTLIFDEVDVGISGPTASQVGQKLKELGENTQVICVTHLPQVASKGHQQKFVTKLTDGEQTQTKVTELNAQGRVREIARLLAGDTVTEHSLANAKELLAS